MHVKCEEALFFTVLEELEKNDILSYVKLTSSLMNPSTPMAFKQVEKSFEYIRDKMGGKPTDMLYQQLAVLYINAMFSQNDFQKVNKGMTMIENLKNELIQH